MPKARITAKLDHSGGKLVLKLPLFTPRGMVRVKRAFPDRESRPVFACSNDLSNDDYLEWQIGYDTADQNAQSRIAEIQFLRNGVQRYGHELSWLMFWASRNQLIERDAWTQLRSVLNSKNQMLEDREIVELKAAPNGPMPHLESTCGFKRYEECAAVYLKQSAGVGVEIRISQRQFAAGSQAMIFVRIPINECCDEEGKSLAERRAKSGEYAVYTIEKKQAGFIIDAAVAFALASQIHAADIRQVMDCLKL